MERPLADSLAHRRSFRCGRGRGVEIEIVIDETKEPLVELARGDRLARHLDHRVVARAERQRDAAHYPDADARRIRALLQRVPVVQGVYEGDRSAARAGPGAHDVESDLDVRLG